MRTEERQALLELWRDVPECRPTNSEGWHLYWDECWCWQQPPDGCVVPMLDRDLGDKLVAALARDAIVEWLMGHGIIAETKGCKGERVAYRAILNEGSSPSRGRVTSGWNPTRLLALCAAARAVKGASDGK